MTYTKPQVAVLGDALRAIELIVIKMPVGIIDHVFPNKKVLPAYDLDE